MTVAEVMDRLDRLREAEKHDREAAAASAEALRIEVLSAIADGRRWAQELAAAAMMTVDEDIGGSQAMSHLPCHKRTRPSPRDRLHV